MQLPVITVTSCEGCGACCSYAGVPPGYGRYYFLNPSALPANVWTAPDAIAWRSMPDHVRAELTEYYDGVMAGTVECRTDEVMPCLWLDPTTRRCRHYEWRPQACRDFLMGGPSCLAVRKGEGIDG